MKKYNIQNYIRYKEDVKSSMPDEDIGYSDIITRDELIIRFLPLVENLAQKVFDNATSLRSFKYQ